MPAQPSVRRVRARGCMESATRDRRRMPETCTRRATPATLASDATLLASALLMHGFESYAAFLQVSGDRVDHCVGSSESGRNGSLVAHVGAENRDLFQVSGAQRLLSRPGLGRGAVAATVTETVDKGS